MLIIISVTIVLSIIFALLGCVCIWKKYVYFSDGLSHASLLIVALSSISQVSISFIGLIIIFIFAALIFKLQEFSEKSEVTNVVTNIMLSLALIITYINPHKVNIIGLLFGDIISANIKDLYILIILSIIIIAFIYSYYHEIIMIVLNKEIAQVNGIKVKKIEYIFLIILGFSVFSAIKIVGALMVNSTLVLPAMTARLISNTPLEMLILSVVISLSASSIGLIFAFNYDLPIAPIIILTGTVFYIITIVRKKLY